MKQFGKQAFTLIELLVVISIILIASSIIFIGGTGGDGAKLSSAQRILSGVAQGARGQAILKNATTRLIIHNDPAEPEKFRRYVGMVYQDSNSGEWFAATQGTYLPDGIFFDATTSSTLSGINWSEESFDLEYPRAQSKSANEAGDGFYYYEYRANGTAVHVNSYLVLRAATPIIPDGEVTELRVDVNDLNLRTGFIIRRAGTTTSIVEPAALPVGVNGTSIPL